jgi:hypothetical protein
MKEFYFHVDRKVAVWKRDYYYIEANSAEEAAAKIKEAFKEDEIYDGSDYGVSWNDCEYLDSDEDVIDYHSNGGPTEQVYFRDGDVVDDVMLEDGLCLCDNTPLEIQRQNKLNELGI